MNTFCVPALANNGVEPETAKQFDTRKGEHVSDVTRAQQMVSKVNRVHEKVTVSSINAAADDARSVSQRTAGSTASIASLCGITVCSTCTGRSKWAQNLPSGTP